MELRAPSMWQCVDFISDIHLHSGDRATFEAWSAYMHSTRADAVCILGDLFEVWVGDDAAQVTGSFEAECVQVLRQAGERLSLGIMHGNRDFLMGPALMQACAATALPDPSVLEFAGERWLLSHGDALCVDDMAYQDFRRQVRSPQWQRDFLAKPLAERQAIATGIRQASAARKQDPNVSYADVDTHAALALLGQAGASHLVHGHTHKPDRHELGAGHRRTVLSDWDLNALPPRAEVLRLHLPSAGGQAELIRLPVAAIASSGD